MFPGNFFELRQARCPYFQVIGGFQLPSNEVWSNYCAYVGLFTWRVFYNPRIGLYWGCLFGKMFYTIYNDFGLSKLDKQVIPSRH